MSDVQPDLCPCGHDVDDEGYCIVEDDRGRHRVRRGGWICVDCAREVL